MGRLGAGTQEEGKPINGAEVRRAKVETYPASGAALDFLEVARAEDAALDLFQDGCLRQPLGHWEGLARR